MGIQNLLIFLFLSIVQASNGCPISYCNNILIKYPFWLQGTQSQKCAPSGFNLSCNDQGYPILHIPGSGNFYVSSIYYSIRIVTLEDVEDCLPERLFNFSLSSTPFMAAKYSDYTFFRCPKGQVISASVVKCASNATFDIFARRDHGDSLGLFSRCNEISTVQVPVSPYYDFGFPLDLDLTWDAHDFPPTGWTEERSDSSKRIALIITIPTIFVLFVIVGCACKMMRCNHPNSNSFQISEVGGSTGRGVNQYTIETYRKITIGESRVEVSNGAACSICLADYAPKDTIRFIPQCEHCFHVECIDKWLSMSRKCPICRIYLPNTNYAAQ